MSETEYRSRITNLLDEHDVAYKLLPHNSAVYTVEEAARQRDVVMEEMVKCILLREPKGRYVMACVRGDMRVDHRAVRKALGDEWRRLHFASADEILDVTGSVQGAVAPLGLPQNLPLLMDERLRVCTRVNISSGDVTFGLELPAQDLFNLSGARFADIAEA